MPRRLWLVLAIVGSGCAPDSRRPPAPTTTTAAQSPLTRTGIEGCNCAGAAPAMTAPDGAAYPFQSIVAYYYQVLQAFWTEIDDEDVLKTWLPASIEAAGEEYYEWQAKSVQIYRDRSLLGFAHRYYRGIFGFLAGEPAGSAASCTPALDAGTRLSGMLAHVGLSQAGVCGRNDDGSTKFWQVNHIVLLMIGDVVDAYALVEAGIARVVEVAPAERCILPQPGVPGPIAGTDPGTRLIPCRIAFRDDAVTEGIVLPVPSSAAVAGVPLEHRAFTAAGTVPMPNALDQVRTILRDGQLRAMYAIGLPRFAPEPSAGPSHVRLVGHAIGPATQPSPVLLPEERGWVDATVGGYAERCCHLECGSAADAAASRPRFAASAIVRRDAGVMDARIHDAWLPDAGVHDAWLPDARVLDASLPDAGVHDASLPDARVHDAGMSFPDSPPPGSGSGSGYLPPGPGPSDGGTSPPPDPEPGPEPTPGDPPGCHTVCVAEGACATNSAATGLVVLVSAQTSAECNGSCPEPATDAPDTQPTCAP